MVAPQEAEEIPARVERALRSWSAAEATATAGIATKGAAAQGLEATAALEMAVMRTPRASGCRRPRSRQR